jgi:hypothetical protein
VIRKIGPPVRQNPEHDLMWDEFVRKSGSVTDNLVNNQPKRENIDFEFVPKTFIHLGCHVARGTDLLCERLFREIEPTRTEVANVNAVFLCIKKDVARLQIAMDDSL